MPSENKGLRYNTNKVRMDLLPPFALQEIAKVFTYGAEKYTIRDKETGKVLVPGDDNWKKGLGWMGVIASAKRHIEAWVSGEDTDKESSLFHIAHAATNLMFLLEFYRIYPQGDDRPHPYLKPPKIGLDIDEVLADWVGHWTSYHGQELPEFWSFDREIGKKFEELKDNKEFWLSIPVKTPPSEIPFEPHCYITSRSIPKEWTEEWLQNNGFPAVPVYSIPHGASKVEVAKQAGVDWFVDDRFENFVELNRAGICCFLFEAKHNLRYDVGYKRIKSLKDLHIPGWS